MEFERTNELQTSVVRSLATLNSNSIAATNATFKNCINQIEKSNWKNVLYSTQSNNNFTSGSDAMQTD